MARLSSVLITSALVLSATPAALASPGASQPDAFPDSPTAWPAPSTTHKPWTRWWWLGSAIDPLNLTRELEAFAKAGIGGVEICPIYGAIGAEDRFIDFLSPKWMQMLAHTTREAARLGMQVDLTTGTGWPFGGPMVTRDHSSRSLQRILHLTKDGKPVALKLPDGELECLLAFPESGSSIDLSSHVKKRRLNWTPPDQRPWTIAGIAVKSGIQQVKRAAPGAQGWVLDPFSKPAMDAYTATFDRAFQGFDAPMPRSQFHDSFEYYAADWTSGFFDSFRQARGYDLRDQLPAFHGQGDPETVRRVRADYRRTLGELHHGYLSAWHHWSRHHGGVTRNQAHGSPGNLLDHYAVSEIPETEIFRHVEDSQIPMMRLAASAAHATSSSLVSAETFTWLDEHFQVRPEQLKQAADFVFLAGVNHLFFHGIPYSPEDAPWPGWLFYAPTHMGPNGGLWRDLPAFNRYLQHCQSILQHGKPDSEVLLYFPYLDLLHNGQPKLPLFTIHNQHQWLAPTRCHQTAMELWNQGITFDFASDDLLKRATVKNGRIHLGHNAFKVLVLPAAKYIDSLADISRLCQQGAKVVVVGALPDEVPGFHHHAVRRKQLAAEAQKLLPQVVVARDGILPVLAQMGVHRESMTADGLRFIRRRHAHGHHYFIVNRSGKAFDGEIEPAVAHASTVVLDPWQSSHSGVTTAKRVHLRLAPGESVVLRTFSRKIIAGPPWPPAPPPNQATPVAGPWKIEFIDGGPTLPAAAMMPAAAPWTTLADPAVRAFSGTARYSCTFDFTGTAHSRVVLDLGKLAHTARVFLNDQPAATCWFPPHTVELTGKCRPGRNSLAIEVTNLAANRIADLDRRKIPWKRFHEINFVNIDYKPFDAAHWPIMESGLIGPVRLLQDK